MSCARALLPAVLLAFLVAAPLVAGCAGGQEGDDATATRLSASTATPVAPPSTATSAGPTSTATPVVPTSTATSAGPASTATPVVPTSTATSAGPASTAASAGPASTAASDGPAIAFGAAVFQAEVADTPEERSQGLSGRTGLAPATGMLFITESGVAPNLWMKDMLFPLDMVWIGAGCTVVDVSLNSLPPAPGAGTSGLPIFQARSAAVYVFEINAGEADRAGIAAGVPVRFTGVPLPDGWPCG